MEEEQLDEPLFPMDVFDHRLAELGASTKTPVVLLTTGSMNPVHAGHLNQLEVVAQRLEDEGHVVLAAWLSPSDAFWSHSKPHGCLSNADKLRLCRLATEKHPLIRTSSWELAQNAPVDYPAVVAAARRVVREAAGRKIKTVYVCGADHAAKLGLYDRDWVAVVGRPGHGRAGRPGEKEMDLSSTAIRKAVAEGRPLTVEMGLESRVAAELESDGRRLLGLT